jgi:hypothetical protein
LDKVKAKKLSGNIQLKNHKILSETALDENLFPFFIGGEKLKFSKKISKFFKVIDEPTDLPPIQFKKTGKIVRNDITNCIFPPVGSTLQIGVNKFQNEKVTKKKKKPKVVNVVEEEEEEEVIEAKKKKVKAVEEVVEEKVTKKKKPKVVEVVEEVEEVKPKKKKAKEDVEEEKPKKTKKRPREEEEQVEEDEKPKKPKKKKL